MEKTSELIKSPSTYTHLLHVFRMMQDSEVEKNDRILKMLLDRPMLLKFNVPIWQNCLRVGLKTKPKVTKDYKFEHLHLWNSICWIHRIEIRKIFCFLLNVSERSHPYSNDARSNSKVKLIDFISQFPLFVFRSLLFTESGEYPGKLFFADSM